MPEQLCAICGINVATTKDHIPPKSIYPKAMRAKNLSLNSIPACFSCNNGAAIEDEELKLYVGLSTGEHRSDSEKIIDSLASTIANNGRLAKRVFQAKKNVYATMDGVVEKPYVAVTFGYENFSKAIARIVRGLYWMETGRPLGLDTKVSVFQFHSMDQEFHKTMSELMNLLQPRFLNEKTFVYKFSPDESGSGIWGIQFFGVPQTTTFAYAEAPRT
jgi:hypothetical protein